MRAVMVSLRDELKLKRAHCKNTLRCALFVNADVLFDFSPSECIMNYVKSHRPSRVFSSFVDGVR